MDSLPPWLIAELERLRQEQQEQRPQPQLPVPDEERPRPAAPPERIVIELGAAILRAAEF